MKISNILMAVVVFSTAGACAQMPVPLLDRQTNARQAPVAAPVVSAAKQEEAVKRLEKLLTCKRGTRFTTKEVASLFQEIGMRETPSGVFLPVGAPPVVFGNPIMAASTIDEDTEIRARVYYKNVPSKTFAKKLGVTKIYEDSPGDEPTFIEKYGLNNIITITGESALIYEFTDFKSKGDYRSSVDCIFINWNHKTQKKLQ